MRVAMPMVEIGIMGMAMRERRMPVPMGMRLAGRRVRVVLMPMMIVMPMSMLVFHGAMPMLVVVVLGQGQP